MIDNSICPLCFENKTQKTQVVFKDRSYYKCISCQLIYCDRVNLPDIEAEKSRYRLHQNIIENTGYLSFLIKIIDPLVLFLNSDMIGIDYGCGPSPIISDILQEKGIMCENYDPFFFPVMPKIFDYDFIISTECFEHFHYPSNDINKIMNILKPGGYLAIMTDTWVSESSMSDWHYLRDFTHVSFYHHKTMLFIAKTQNLSIVYTDSQRVYIFKKET